MRKLVLISALSLAAFPALAEGCNWGAKQLNASVKTEEPVTTATIESTMIGTKVTADAIVTAEAPVSEETRKQ
jgi:hypothetical protein